ncbi:MAG: alpha/beta hydrolase [Gemmatimonadetes bacterium]|nr:alpha/beta hydrolase [Gemmatimonadota bacterium]
MRQVASLLLVCVAAALPAQAPVTLQQVMGVATRAPNEVIRYGEAPEQFGHLRLPQGPGPFPVVVFIHGGCWLSQFGIEHAAPLEQAFADSGYAVWSLEYRRVGNPGGGWPGTFRDIAAGADHLRTVARQHPLDLTRVIASGHSAGGFFALWLAARRRLPVESELHDPDPLRVTGVLALAPAPDLEGLHTAGVCGQVIGKLMGGSPSEVPARYGSASMMRLAPIEVPTEAVIGEADASWAPVGRAYVSRATAVGDARLHVAEVAGAGHFDVIAPFAPAWRAVMEGLRRLVPEVTAR